MARRQIWTTGSTGIIRAHRLTITRSTLLWIATKLIRSDGVLLSVGSWLLPEVMSTWRRSRCLGQAGTTSFGLRTRLIGRWGHRQSQIVHSNLNVDFKMGTTVIVPGPGSYESKQDLNPEGKYYVSKFGSSGSKVWNPKTSQRFTKSTNGVPGSGTYHPVNEISD